VQGPAQSSACLSLSVAGLVWPQLKHAIPNVLLIVTTCWFHFAPINVK